ncbi:hypothetical protein C0J52_10244 [Blattella germanica]|nr:hypothetical protein C0J52_10244 [Blattella germanica]
MVRFLLLLALFMVAIAKDSAHQYSRLAEIGEACGNQTDGYIPCKGGVCLDNICHEAII